MTANFHPKILPLYSKDGCHDALHCDVVMIILVVGLRLCSHLSFTDDEEGVSSGPLSDDVLTIFVMCLSEEKTREVKRKPEKGGVIQGHEDYFFSFLTLGLPN